MSDKKNYLFTLTITSVQSFISQARKTKDLFAGSEILSNLMRQTLDTLNKTEIIFPQNKNFVSNKIVVKLEDKTKEDIEKLGKELKDSINNKFVNLIFKKTNKCDNNLQNFFQVFWVAVELGDDYKKSYKELEKNLGAVKNLRIFTQQGQLKGIEKCQLCGERNQVKDKKNTKDRLCLICLTKRECSLSDNDYPSTADIVLLPKKYNEAQKYLEDNPSEKKYYALLQFDIDDMGKKLSSLDEDGQKILSKQLGEFAKKAKGIVDKSGQTIYAGGDDFLGFLNLNYLFRVIYEIKEAFQIDDMTFSTSIIIAHYKSPLHKVLNFSRELLDETKNHFDDKNGVGIIVLSDSSINAKTFCRYEDLTLLEKMNSKKIGMSLHYKLQTVFNFLDDKLINHTEYQYEIEMLEIEIKRLLKREEGDFDELLYSRLIGFLHQQVTGLNTENNIKVDFDNFIGYLKTLEQLRKVS